MDKEVFKFPDEKEPKDEIKVEVEQPETEIEIVDDTPPEDQNRPPMKEPPQDVTEDELENYSESVKKRIQHFSKGYHEERRAKEAALREKEEALRITQALIEQNKKLQQNVGQNHQALLQQAKTVVEKQLEEARRNYKSAYESGDTEGLLKAQEALVEAKTKAERLKNYRPPVQKPENVVQTQEPQVDPKAEAWRNRNSWFGNDKRKTAVALTVHQELIESGVNPSSDEYYQKLDAEIRSVFPDATPPKREPEINVVAPVSRSVAPKKITLTKTQVALAKRLGLTLEQYARQVADDMRKSNER